MKRILQLSVVFLTAGCSSNDNETLRAVFGTGNEHFQSVSIGDKHANVLRNVAATVITNNEDGVTTAFEKQDVSVSVQYEFEDEELYSIQADLFFPDTAVMNKFEQLLINRYNNKYGALSENGGFFVWQENNQVEFTLADESIEFGQPKISLTIYNFDY
jgi:hypothetical protein